MALGQESRETQFGTTIKKKKLKHPNILEMFKKTVKPHTLIVYMVLEYMYPTLKFLQRIMGTLIFIYSMKATADELTVHSRLQVKASERFYNPSNVSENLHM